MYDPEQYKYQDEYEPSLFVKVVAFVGLFLAFALIFLLGVLTSAA